MATKQQQVAEVVEGLGLGLISLGVLAVPSKKLGLEFAFSHAWRRWTHAEEYPSIGKAPKPDNEFWIGVTKSARRSTPAIVWLKDGPRYTINLQHVEWELTEVADLIGSRPLIHWAELAAPFQQHVQKYA